MPYIANKQTPIPSDMLPIGTKIDTGLGIGTIIAWGTYLADLEYDQRADTLTINERRSYIMQMTTGSFTQVPAHKYPVV